MTRPTCTAALALSSCLALAGCATAAPKPDAPSAAAAQAAEARVIELQKQLSALNQKLDGMEFKLSALNDKVDATRTSVDTIGKTRDPETGTQEVHSHPVDSALPGKTGAVSVKKSTTDPELGFVTDGAVQTYRKAMALFDSGKYPDAVLLFSQFLDQYADHPFAGSSQFHIGKSYVLQNECKLAVQEFARVLTSYDRSPHVPDALQQMAQCEDSLKETKQAASHRQMLMSLYPNSPAARSQPAPQPAPQQPATPPTAPALPTAPSEQEEPRS